MCSLEPGAEDLGEIKAITSAGSSSVFAMGTSSKKGDLVGIRAALDVVVATPPGAGRSCLGRWFSSSHRLLDAASAAALYRDFIMHYLLATPTWTRTWKASAAANSMP